jgi:hypothetical protein
MIILAESVVYPTVFSPAGSAIVALLLFGDSTGISAEPPKSKLLEDHANTGIALLTGSNDDFLLLVPDCEIRISNSDGLGHILRFLYDELNSIYRVLIFLEI